MAANSPRKRLPTPEICPVCGEDVPRHALACPECGADHLSGWRENATVYDGTGLPDEDSFDYDEYVQREFGGPSPRPPGVRPLWWLTALALIAALVWIFLRPFYSFF